MMTVPLETGYCPERWKQAIGVVLENIPVVSRYDKLRIIQLLHGTSPNWRNNMMDL
jgi:hypothetical protein